MAASTLPTDPHEHHPYLFLFIGAVLLAAGVLKSAQSRVPLTIALFLLGAACGALADICPTLQAFIEPIHAMAPSFLFYVFFPVLIFEAAFNCNAAVFQRMWREIFSLAFPGMLLATALTGFFIKTAMYPQWAFPTCFLYGAIISATDPVATLAILRDLGADERVRAVLDGESIFNDGAAMVLYAVLVPVVERSGVPEDSANIDWLMQGFQCLQLTGGSFALGLAMGALLVFALSKCVDRVVETTLIYGLSVIAFFIAEAWLHVSGVLTLCCMGLCFAFRRHVVHPQNASFINAVWEVLVYSANVLIFTIVGIDVSNQRFHGMTWHDYLMVPVLYIALLAIRCAVVSVCLGFCRCGPKPQLGWRESVVIACNGLRGAVALTLALVLRHDRRIASVRLKKQFVLLTAGQVCLTTVVNGLLCKPLVRALGLLRPSKAKLAEISWACKQIAEASKAKRHALENAGVFRDVDWRAVGDMDAVPEGLRVLTGLFEYQDTENSEMTEKTHFANYHRLFENISQKLFAKGYLATCFVHIARRNAQLCLLDDRLLKLADFMIRRKRTLFDTHQRASGRLALCQPLLHPLRRMRHWLDVRAFHTQLDVFLGYRTVLESVRDALMCGHNAVCRTECFPKALKKWLTGHVSAELTAVTNEIERMERNASAVQGEFLADGKRVSLHSSQLSRKRLVERILLRAMRERVDELRESGLVDDATAERFASDLRLQEIK